MLIRTVEKLVRAIVHKDQQPQPTLRATAVRIKDLQGVIVVHTLQTEVVRLVVTAKDEVFLVVEMKVVITVAEAEAHLVAAETFVMIEVVKESNQLSTLLSL